MSKGFDANRNLSPFTTCLLKEGYEFIGRYYNIKDKDKNLTFSEAKTLSQKGFRIVAVWENGFPKKTTYFSRDKGIFDGTAAIQYASLAIKQPSKTPIYFGIDYDASHSDVDGVITEYFKGVAEAFKLAGNKYLVGVYGSGLVCRKIMDAELASHSWLAQSRDWRDSKTYKDYNIKQFDEKPECIGLGTVKGDPNESPGNNEGSFKISSPIDSTDKMDESL